MATDVLLEMAARKIASGTWLRAWVVENWVVYLRVGSDMVYSISEAILGEKGRLVPVPRSRKSTISWPAACRMLSGVGRCREQDAEKRRNLMRKASRRRKDDRT